MFLYYIPIYAIRRLLGALIFAVLLMAFLGLCLQPLNAASSEDYKLGTEDKVHLRVFEWRAQVDQFFEWEALNGEFLVGQSGTISVPLLGEITASGLSTRELAKAVSDRMISQLGLRYPPQVAVEVSEYRPFFIVGAVATPGAYPYRPGLTVLRALSIAGGLPGSAEARSGQLGRNLITSRGALARFIRRRYELEARKARLAAELKGTGTIDFPETFITVKDRPDIARIIEQEQGIFTARRTALASQIQTLDRLRTFLAEEVKSLREQVGLKKSELDSVGKELANVKKLVAKGLAPKTRRFNLERIVSQLSSERLQVETLLLRTQQEISRTEVEIETTSNNNTMEVTTQLRETETELEDTLVQLQTQQRLLREAALVYPGAVSSHDAGSAGKAKYIIVRTVSGQSQEIEADETASLSPGDTVKVIIPISESATELVTGTSKRMQ